MDELLRSNDLLTALLYMLFAIGTIAGGFALWAATRHFLLRGKRRRHDD